MVQPIREINSVKLTREITKENLPLSCPLPADQLWNAHPRVYLPIEETGREVCPYCSTEYILKNAE